MIIFVRFYFLLIFSFCVFSSHASHARTLLEGFWTGATAIAYDAKTTRKAGGERVLKVDLVVAGEYGHLKVNPDVGVGTLNPFCEYYFSHDVGKVDQIVLKPGGHGQVCGRNPEIKVVRRDSETVFFTIQDSVMGLSETFPLSVRHGYIPDGERSIVPENFTIFDIELGMLRSEVEERLLKRKYARSRSGSRILNGVGWQQDASLYEDKNENKIYVLYSAVAPDNQDFSQEYAVLLSRYAEIPSDKNVTFTAFSNSVSLKYGPKETGELSRYYDYDGNLISAATEMICDESKRQSVKVMFHRYKKFTRDTTVRPFCGSGVEIFTKSNKKTGLIDSYDLTLWNYDMIVDNDWRKVAYQTIENAKIYLDRLSLDHVDIDL